MSWHTPIGYEWMDGRIQIAEDYKAIVLMIFTDYDEGMTALQIAKKLMKAEVVNPRGRVAWTHTTVGRILDNSKYLGTEEYPRLIDEALFNRVQARREEQRQMLGKGVYKKNAKEKQLFADILVCGKCEGVYRYHCREDIYPRWRCKRDIPPKKNPCNNEFLSEEQLKNICIYAINKFIQNSGLIERYKEKGQKLSKEFRILDRKIQQSENLSSDELMELLFERASERYKTLEVRDEVMKTETMKNAIEQKTELEEFDEQLLRKLIKKLVVYPKHTVKVIFHNKDSLKVNYKKL